MNSDLDLKIISSIIEMTEPIKHEGNNIFNGSDEFLNGLENNQSITHMPHPYHSFESCINYSENVSYWNVSCDTLLEYSIPLYGYCMPILLLTTVVANSLIVLVLSKRTMATSTNMLLMGMAICDMLTVIFPAPGLAYMYTFGNHYKPLYPIAACLTYSIFNEILPAIFHTASIWLTVALAIQRYIFVCHPTVGRTWCTMARVKKSIFYICLTSFLHQSTRFFDRTYSPLSIEWNGTKVTVCHMEIAHWVNEYVGIDSYYIGYFMFRILFVHLLPCITLVTLNVLLFRAMKKAQERRKMLFHENRQKECKRLRDTNCTTLMLIVVVTVFLIVEIPIAIITSLHIISAAIVEFLDYNIANLFILLANFFVAVSYPINFGIYCGMSRQFRTTFREIFIMNPSNNKRPLASRQSIANEGQTFTNETLL